MPPLSALQLPTLLPTLLGVMTALALVSCWTTSAAATPTDQQGNKSVSVLIIPSTKWCGNGNIASNYDSLGSEYETDKCCRDHDTCPHSIVALQTRYGLRNPFLTTLSECECDVRFYFCLQQAAKLSTTAQFAISSFFRVLNMPCFELVERPVCQRRRFGFAGRCLAVRNETVAELRQLPFFTDHLARALDSGRLSFHGSA